MRVLSFIHLLFGSFREFNGVSQRVFVFLLIPCCLCVDFRAPPLIPNVPLLWGWNAPTDGCTGKFNEPLDMSFFSLVGSPRKGLTGQSITIFYTDRLGYYPHIDSTGAIEHGGIPQAIDLQEHLDKAKDDILYYMPADNVGLAVIDWEEWRPTWARNWKPKDTYKNKSIELVQQQNVQLSITEATKIAQAEFEKAGKSFMEETLKLGKSLRPNHLWGYYLFPDCYNHDYNNPSYNGNCPPVEKKRNDALDWMWKQSTALYPSIYLKSTLRSSQKAALFVRNRVQEAIRVSKVADPKHPLPIFVYTRLVFTDQSLEFLSQEDLVNTVGETVALGVSGIVIWGALSLARNLKSCLGLHDYMETTLNPYLINVTLAAKMCSQVLCQEEGMCKRKDWDSDDYLHLNPKNFVIQTVPDGKYVIQGTPTLEDLQYLSEKFDCSCYANLHCKTRLDVENVRTINVCAIEDVCIDAFLDSESSAEPLDSESSAEPPESESSAEPLESESNVELPESESNVEPSESESNFEPFNSQNKPSVPASSNSQGGASAAVSPHVSGKGLRGWLLVVYIFFHSI